jgi:hypothetical protein
LTRVDEESDDIGGDVDVDEEDDFDDRSAA